VQHAIGSVMVRDTDSIPDSPPLTRTELLAQATALVHVRRHQGVRSESSDWRSKEIVHLTNLHRGWGRRLEFLGKFWRGVRLRVVSH
jgi:hypothetical protein